MPRSSASFGDSKCTGLPSTRYWPAEGACTPASVLISVDLPAPLSPSRQCTSPRRRRSVTPESAITLPKYLLTFSSDRMMSSCLRVSDMVVSRLRLRDATAYIVVEQHRDQQHHAEEHAEPV